MVTVLTVLLSMQYIVLQACKNLLHCIYYYYYYYYDYHFWYLFHSPIIPQITSD